MKIIYMEVDDELQEAILFALEAIENKERIENSIRTYSENWSYERIGKVEIIILSLGISELIMDLTPKKVIISEWVKLCDKHSSSQSAKFVNGILNTISENINNE